MDGSLQLYAWPQLSHSVNRETSADDGAGPLAEVTSEEQQPLAIHEQEPNDRPDNANVGEVPFQVAGTIDAEGRIDHDRSKPDGTPRKLMDVGKLTAAGWT